MRVNKSKYIIAWGVSASLLYGATLGGTERKREPCYMLIIQVKMAVKLRLKTRRVTIKNDFLDVYFS